MKTASFWLKNKLSQLATLLDQERKIGVEILEILFEIEQRKSYSELGYDGLFSFCVKELKFSESQAFQRIQAMRALRTTPELKEKIKSGALNVSTVSQVQVFLRQEQAQGIQRSVEEKKEFFEQFENKTSKEVKITLRDLKGERVHAKLLLELDEEAESLWKEFKSMSAHQNQGDDLNAFKLLLKTWLKVNAKKMGSTKSNESNQVTPRDSVSTDCMKEAAASTTSKNLNSQRSVSGSTQVTVQNARVRVKSNETKPIENQPSRYIPLSTRRLVFARDQFKCTDCGSKHALTIEHIIPFAKGGKHDLDNLKLLCRNCNLHQGVMQFGTNAMKRGEKSLYH